MKRIFTCLAAAWVLQASTAHAQSTEKDFSVGIGVETGIVTGDFKPLHKIGAGITARFSYLVGPGFATLSSGGIVLFPRKGDGSLDPKAGVWIPIKAGYKLIIRDNFFVMGEVGYSLLRYYFEDAYGLSSTTQGGFVYAPTVGVQFGVVELGLRYQSATIKGATLSMGLLRLGFNF